MKPSAYFINIARSGVRVDDDLADAPMAGVIAGAGVDVLRSDPAKPDHRLLMARSGHSVTAA